MPPTLYDPPFLIFHPPPLQICSQLEALAGAAAHKGPYGVGDSSVLRKWGGSPTPPDPPPAP